LPDEHKVGLLFRDITDRIAAAETQRLLLNELNHRVKNMLATVQSVAMQTQRSTPEAFAERFEARLMALSRAHDLLTQRQWAGVGLRELLQQAVLPFAGGSDPAIRMKGPDHTLSAQAGLALAMVVHELATNAAKYGALSTPSGRVDVEWTVEPTKGSDWISLSWTEKNGPATKTPSRRGFGSRLIERSVSQDLSGKAELQFLPTGLECTLAFPLPASNGGP